jgi:hypothetical protein
MSSNDKLVNLGFEVNNNNKDDLKNDYMKSLPSLKKFGDN